MERRELLKELGDEIRKGLNRYTDYTPFRLTGIEEFLGRIAMHYESPNYPEFMCTVNCDYENSWWLIRGSHGPEVGLSLKAMKLLTMLSEDIEKRQHGDAQECEFNELADKLGEMLGVKPEILDYIVKYGDVVSGSYSASVWLSLKDGFAPCGDWAFITAPGEGDMELPEGALKVMERMSKLVKAGACDGKSKRV